MAPDKSTRTTKVFNCPDCDKTFSRREYVNRHSRQAHKGTRPFQCEACNTSFARSDILKRHKTTCAVLKHGRIAPQRDASGLSSNPDAEIDEIEDDGFDQKGAAQGFSRDANSQSTESVDRNSNNTAAIAMQDTRFIGTSYTGDVSFATYAPPTAHRNDSISSTSSSSATPFRFSPDASPLSSSSSTLDSPQSSLVNNCVFDKQRSLPIPQLQTHPASSSSSSSPSSVPAPDFSLMYLMPTSGSTSNDQFGGGAFGGANQTLAPELSRGSSFTQDEIMVSEVLEDLLRTPSAHRVASPGGYFSQNAATAQSEQDQQGSSALVTTPSGWQTDRPMLSAHEQNYPSSIVGGTGWEYGAGLTDPINSIESSPEAIALANYFNKGGVGGISALDLGFYNEPSLWSDLSKLEEPTLHTERDHNFYLPAQNFCLAYLSPWNVPPIARLSQFAIKASEEFLPSIPVVHTSSIKLSEAPKAMAFALTVVGAAYAKDSEGFSDEMLVEKRVFLVRNFNKEDASEEDRFASLQGLLLYQLLGLFHRDQEQRLLANTFHAALILMVRKLDLPNRIRQTRLPIVAPDLSGDELETAWKSWISLETRRRVTFICFLTDLETATNFKTPPLLPFPDLNIDLPSHDRLWNAKNAIEWRDALQNPGPSINFLQAVRTLMAPNEPSPFSPDGILLADLSRLSSFSLLVLARTLSYLQLKTEDAMRSVDPFRTLLGGFGLLDERESENRDILVRIARGRARLRSLPGGVKRGSGEGWFEDVMPTSAKRANSTSSSSPTSSSSSASPSSQPSAPAFASTPAPCTPGPFSNINTSSLFDDLEEYDPNAIFTDYAENPKAFVNAPISNVSNRSATLPLYQKDESAMSKIERLATKRASTLAQEFPSGWFPNF